MNTNELNEESEKWTNNKTHNLQNFTDVTEEDGPSLWITWTGAGVVVTVAILGILGNSVTIGAYRRNRKLQTTFNHLITNLCAVDLVFSAVVMPANLPLIITSHNVYPPALCSVVGFVYYCMMSSSVITLVFIAINRFVGIVQSHRYRFMFSKDMIKWWLIAAWLSSPIFYLPFEISRSLEWRQSSLRCVLPSKSAPISIKIYHATISILFQFVPTVILIVLYRAILKKVKKCRKTVEHYPNPTSRSPSWAEGGDPSQRRRAMRHHSPRISRNESTTCKSIDSPKINKSGLMVYLQVPHNKSNSSNETQRRNNLKVQTRIVKGARSSPNLLDVDVTKEFKTNKGKDTSQLGTESLRRKSWGDESEVKFLADPLVTSERPRRRIVMAMRDLQVMSTIDSETNSKSVSFDQAEDTHDQKSHDVPSSATMHTIDGSKEMEGVADAKSTMDGNPKQNEVINLEVPKEEDSVTLPASTLTLPTTNVMKHSKSQNQLRRQPSVIKESPEEENKQQQDPVKREEEKINKLLNKTVCVGYMDASANSVSLSKPEDVIRRNSNDCNVQHFLNNNALKEAAGSKRRRWQKSCERLEKKENSSLNERGHVCRRAKSEGSQSYRKSWKRTWSRKASESPSIKIVIEQATSEDTPPIREDFDSCNGIVSDSSHQSKINKNSSKTQRARRCNCCRNLIQKILSAHKSNRGNEQQENKLICESGQPNVGRNDTKNAATSNEIPLGGANDRNSVEKTWVKLKDFELKCLDSSAPNDVTNRNNISATSDFIAESSDFITSDERRSSVTSRLYRYTSAGECLSRQGSYSCISYADDYTRRSTNNRLQSQESGSQQASPKKTDCKGIRRRNSLYLSWTSRKSFCLSSYNSGASNDSRRRKRCRAAERHLAFSGLVICIAFAICVLPTSVIEVLDSLLDLNISPNIKFMASMLSWFHAIVNPVIYGFFNPQYRLEFRRMWRHVKRSSVFCGNEDGLSKASSKSSLPSGNHHSRSWYPASWWDGRNSRRPSELT